MENKLEILYIGQPNQVPVCIAEQDKFSYSTAANIVQAINSLQTQRLPDAIVCEYHLPGKTGIDMFDWVRKQNFLAGIPFILVSRQFSSELFKLALDKKVDDFYIESSINKDAFIERIKFLTSFRKKTSPDANAQNDRAFVMPVSKRIFDITVASVALLLASPVLIIVSISILLESRGKIYFISKRVGRKVFDFYKLRSMRTGAEDQLKKLAAQKNQYDTKTGNDTIRFDLPCPECRKLTNGQTCSPVMFINNHQICDNWYTQQKLEIARSKSPFVKINQDPRVTRIGKIIRNTSIDELPQLINVLKGDMSIVGNRPLPVYEAELLTVETLSKRFLAPAGITGLWQVELRGKGGKMSEEERKKLDNEYAEHFKDGKYSFWFDMKLILKTIPALLQKSAV